MYVMRRSFFATFSMMAITLFLCTNGQAQQKSARSDDDDGWNDNFHDNPGVWTAITYEDKAHIQFGGFHWSSSSTFLLSELGTLPAGKEGSFVVKRDPGTVTFNGIFSGNKGHGTYIFEENAAFKSYLEQEGFKELTEELMLHLFFTNINKEYFGYMKENGYTGVTMSQLKDLAYQNINRNVLAGYLDLFKKEEYGKVSIERIIELREHGVSPRFINSFHEMGYKSFSLEKALELKDHGVNPEFITEMKKAGAKDITLDEAIELRDHGVSSSFVAQLKEMGYPDVTLQRAVELRDHGVSIEFIREFQRLGYKDITLKKAEELRDHGVTADYIRGLQEKGLKNLSLDQYQRLRDSGM